MAILELLNILCGALLSYLIIRPILMAAIYAVREVKRGRSEGIS